MQDTRTPVKIAVVALLTNIIMSLILMGPLKHSGLAFANAIASSVNFFLLFYFCGGNLERIDARRIIKSFTKVCLASALMGLAGWFLLHGELWRQGGRSMEKAGYLSGVIIMCTALYFFMSYLLKSEEMEYLMNMVKKKIQGGK